jgi:8-oxo-dGTP pyrophosphatase MutT (NUDIX family)
MAGNEKDPPVKLLGRRIIAENSKFTIHFDHIIDTATNSEVFDYLTLGCKAHGRDGVTGVTVVPVWAGKVLLLANYRHAVGKTLWEGARGFIDPSEEASAAALRETREETGLIGIRVVPLGHIHPEGSTMISRTALFAVFGDQRLAQTVEDEVGLGTAQAFAIADIREMLLRFAFEEVSTAIALHRFIMAVDAGLA